MDEHILKVLAVEDPQGSEDLSRSSTVPQSQCTRGRRSTGVGWLLRS